MPILVRAKVWKTGAAAFIAAMLMLPLCSFAQAQNQLQLSEQKIKAGLIYNFLKYTDWPPPKTEGPLIVCIFGSGDPFNGYLNPMEERTVNQRTITIRHVSSKEQTASCHMLFISSDEQAQWPALHRFLADKSVLTVGDFDGFSKDGGMIEFGIEENRLQIWLNIQAVTETHLRIYDSLRRLAKTTHPSSAGGAE